LELRRSSESSLLQCYKLRSFSGAPELAFAATQKGPEFRRSSESSLLQRSKPRSSEEAPEAPCCNAVSSGAPEKL
jgi:hypothetical protein